ncbi:hypothetical protein N7526_008241 [Penicillium atrosanguineum]|nr:hypothetical protein N7526_008241 [Penicillium atrosanguineum]
MAQSYQSPNFDTSADSKRERALGASENHGVSHEYEDPFGDEEFAEVKYRTLYWWQCGMIMIAETISLGILSLPSAVATLGLVAAVILIAGLGLLATYTGYVIGQFKLRYPHVHSMGDAGEIMFGTFGWGRFGREFLGTAQLLFLVFIMGSHILTFTVMMNTLTDHGTCSIVFGVVGLIISFIFALPRTLRKVSWFSFASFISILSALLITMIAIAIQRPGDGHVDATTKISAATGFLAVTNIVFAYAGHVAFFGFISEMQKPTDYPKTLYMLQATDTILYIIAAVVIYYYGGNDVKSPALSSTSPITAKVAYGIAIPTIVIAGVINGHVAAKYIYVRLFRGSDRMHKRSFVSVGSWVGITLVLWIVAWIIAEAIPVFNNLLSLITALFASWFTYGLSGIFWLFLNRGRYVSSPRKIFLTILNLLIVGIGGCLCGMGLGAQSDTNPGETMRLAVERFRTRMESSNRCFIQDCVDEIEAMRLLTEDGKFSLMRPYWYELGVTGLSDWNYDAPRGPVLRARETENVSRLEDLKTIFHEHMDGIIPPMLVTDKWRQIFLETIENVCNEAAVQDKKDEDFHIPVCDELGHFIKYANGVQHPDFRRSGKASDIDPGKSQWEEDLSTVPVGIEQGALDNLLDHQPRIIFSNQFNAVGAPVPLTVGVGTAVPVTTTTAATANPTSLAPLPSGGAEGCVAIVYYQNDHKNMRDYHGYEFYPLTPSMDVCPGFSSSD